MNTKRTELDLLRDMIKLIDEEHLLRLRHRATRAGDDELAERLLNEFHARESREDAERRGAALRMALQRSFRSRLVE